MKAINELREEIEYLKRQNELHETLSKLKTIMEHNLTMENWDNFIVILQEN